MVPDAESVEVARRRSPKESKCKGNLAAFALLVIKRSAGGMISNDIRSHNLFWSISPTQRYMLDFQLNTTIALGV